jgi:hypothetical protein
MGRWGEPPAKAARERSIAVCMKKPPMTFQTTPENVGKENNLYPPWVEKLWNLYEGDLIRIAGDLDVGALQQGDEGYLLFHVSALKPRKASFLDDLNDYQTSHSLPLFTETNLPVERVNARGNRTGVLTTRVPFAEKTASNAAVNLLSRSRIKNLKSLARSPWSIGRLRAWWAVHAPVGCAVTPRMCTLRPGFRS